MRTLFITTLVLLAAPFLAPADASHCVGPTTASPEFDLFVDGSAPHYYVDLYVNGGPEGGLWAYAYEETNGVDGLQRADEIEDNTCHGMIVPDTWVLL